MLGRTWGGTLGRAWPAGETSRLIVHLPQLAFLLYNDQPPNYNGTQDTSSRGHTKGEAQIGVCGRALVSFHSFLS